MNRYESHLKQNITEPAELQAPSLSAIKFLLPWKITLKSHEFQHHLVYAWRNPTLHKVLEWSTNHCATSLWIWDIITFDMKINAHHHHQDPNRQSPTTHHTYSMSALFVLVKFVPNQITKIKTRTILIGFDTIEISLVIHSWKIYVAPQPLKTNWQKN